MSVEWRQKRFGTSVVRLTEEREQDALSDRDGLVRQLQVEFKGSPGRRVSLSGRTSVLLSELAPTRSRVRSRLKGRVAVGRRLKLTGEAEYDLFGNRAAAASIGKVGVGGDVWGREQRQPVGPDATAEEQFASWNPFIANSGTYTLEGSTLTLHIGVAKVAGVMGTSTTVEVEFDGDALLLTGDIEGATGSRQRWVRVN